MRVKGQLYIVGDDDRRLACRLDLDVSFSILTAEGAVACSVHPGFVSMERIGGDIFQLGLGDRRFGFVADDALDVTYRFLPELIERRQATRLRSRKSKLQSEHSAASALTDLLDGRRTDEVVESPSVDHLPVIGSPETLSPRPDVDNGRSSRERAHDEDARDESPERRADPRTPLERRRLSMLRLPVEELRRRRIVDAPRLVDVGGVKMAYRVEGHGRPLVLLGGGVGGMDVWRRMLPHVVEEAKVFRVDFVGFGESERIPDADLAGYDWQTHVAHLDACLNALLPTDDVTILCHGFNTGVALEWARHHEERVRGIGYADGLLRPMAWSEATPWLREAVKLVRGTEDVRDLLRSDDYLDRAVEEFAPGGLDSESIKGLRSAMGPPGPARLAHFATLANIPLGGQPSSASKMMRACYRWLKETHVPKLLMLGRPGYLLRNRGRALAAKLPNQTICTVDGAHLLPLTAPDAVGIFAKLWLRTL